jgi:hypothetical protein
MLRRFLASAQTRNIEIEKNLNQIRYIIPITEDIRDGIFGKFQYVIVRNDEIVVAVSAPGPDAVAEKEKEKKYSLDI